MGNTNRKRRLLKKMLLLAPFPDYGLSFLHSLEYICHPFTVTAFPSRNYVIIFILYSHLLYYISGISALQQASDGQKDSFLAFLLCA